MPQPKKPNKHWTALQEAHESRMQTHMNLTAEIETALLSYDGTDDLPPDIIKQIAVQGAQIVMMTAQGPMVNPLAPTDSQPQTGPANE